MSTNNTHSRTALIIGAGRGGHALLEMFLEENLVNVIAVADINPDAPGIVLARKAGIPAYRNAGEAIMACKDHPDCIVFNLTHDDSIGEEVSKVFGNKRVTSGLEVELFWQMVTNLKQIKDEFEKSQNQLRSITHNVIDGIIMINESGEICGFNPAASQIFGYLQQDVMGKNVDVLMPDSYRGEHDTYINRYVSSGKAHVIGARGHNVVAVRKGGEHFPMELSISEMVLGGQRYFSGIFRDVSECKLAEEKIVRLAQYDYLTGLPNRARFMDYLEYSIALARRYNHKLAVMFLDIDGFKQVTDAQGHESGDLLLQGVARRLKEVIRTSDTVARIGGDKFTFVLNDVRSHEYALLVANKIFDAMAEPFDVNGRQHRVGASIGIALFPDDSDKPGKLLRQADDAMYLAKQCGKNTYRLFREVAGATPRG
ncbi:MAG: diguanylate cyclase [Gallionella sp.]|nr:diguanylate cyclase [Gallionella sp.]